MRACTVTFFFLMGISLSANAQVSTNLLLAANKIVVSNAADSVNEEVNYPLSCQNSFLSPHKASHVASFHVTKKKCSKKTPKSFELNLFRSLQVYDK